MLAKNSIANALLGVYSASPRLLEERNEVLKYYNFYDGEAKSDMDELNEITRGQSWEVPPDLDFTPSEDIRNHTKKLLQKQGRFMFGVDPTILIKPLNPKDKDPAESKRAFIERILTEAEFFSETYKAFIDSTIGKRVLLLAKANPGEPIRFSYYTMDQFTYKTDPDDHKRITEVIIAYLTEESADKPAEEQVWYRWRYYYEGEKVILDYGEYDGSGKVIEGTEEISDTELTQIPARVITNGGLTAETDGVSDIKELMNLADAYNRTLSDYRDALRFRMFEQAVFTDVDPASLENAKIAPNAMLDLATDPAAAQGTKAAAAMLSSSFSFKDAAEYYLNRTLSDMYELMDQPRPEEIKNVPSAKAMRYIFYDLMGRCEEKWKAWEPAILWAIDFIIEAVDKFDLYGDDPDRKHLKAESATIIKHNYPIPEDEETKKETALKEVTNHTKSIKTYIQEYGDVIDESAEFREIIKEIKEVALAESDPYDAQINAEEGGAATPSEPNNTNDPNDPADPNEPEGNNEEPEGSGEE